ncbi:MAG: TonB-dependent receptor [Bacteroidales bacterium]|nr:TonB-dependent receptor [Bacteroidales bacterium]
MNYRRGYIHSLFVFFTVTVFSLPLCGQNPDMVKISAVYSHTAVLDAFLDLTTRYGVQFFYRDSIFAGDTISYAGQESDLSVFLQEVLRGKPLEYRIVGSNKVVFLPSERVALLTGAMINMAGNDMTKGMIEVGNPADAGKYRRAEIRGRILNGKNGEPLPGASLQVENLSVGTTSNMDGSFSLVLQPGIYNLQVACLGFEQQKFSLKVIGPGAVDLELFEESVRLEEVKVFAKMADRNVRSNTMGLIDMDMRDFKLLPPVGGDKDIMKRLSMMPGISSAGEFGSGISVRGGGDDQNLYLLEGASVYNTSHVFGLMSVINPDAVAGMKLYRGYIPAEFGERVSSVIDIRVRDNARKGLHGQGGIGLFNSRVMFNGTLPGDHISWMLGGRSSYSDWILGRLPDYNLRSSHALFHDLNGLFQYKNSKNHLTFFAYSSFDRFRYAGEFTYRYGNNLASARWTRIFNANWNTELTASVSDYYVARDDLAEASLVKQVSSGIRSLDAKLVLNWSKFHNHRPLAGVQAIHYTVYPGSQKPLNSFSLINPLDLENSKGYETAFFAGDDFDLSDWFGINAGLRFSVYQLTGPYQKFLYGAEGPLSPSRITDTIMYTEGLHIVTFHSFEPRLAVKFMLNQRSSVKFSFSKNTQYLMLLSYTSIPTPNDVWKLADPYIRPVSSRQLAMGYFRNSADNFFEFSAEIYYRWLENLPEYKNDALLEMNPHPETELIKTSGRNYGIECMIRKNGGRIDGWINYTYSRAWRRTNGRYSEEIINKNKWYPSMFDRPHDLNVSGTYYYNRRLRFTANFYLSSGRPTTLPEYQFDFGNNMLVWYSDRNAYRLPPYHRLDLSVSRDESLHLRKKWKGSWTFSVLNIYGRKNAYSVFYKKAPGGLQDNYDVSGLYKMYLIGRPFPVVTYNFIF